MSLIYSRILRLIFFFTIIEDRPEDGEESIEFMRSQSRQSKNIYDPLRPLTIEWLIRHKTRNVSMELSRFIFQIETEDQKPKR